MDLPGEACEPPDVERGLGRPDREQGVEAVRAVQKDGEENEQRPRHAKRKRSRSKRRRSGTKTTEKTVEVTAHEEVRVKLEQPEGPELFDFVQGGYPIDSFRTRICPRMCPKSCMLGVLGHV